MGSPDSQAVSVIVTVLNEAGSLPDLLDSLTMQTRAPDEVVVVDGGSRDGTLALLEEHAARPGLALTVLSRPGTGISAGRNAAIAAARGPVIASTDAGVRLEPEWLERLTAPLAAGTRVVSGFFVPDARGAFETALGATTLPEVGDVDPARFLPSSRSVAFLKADWAECGGYPEWLDYCEDLVFDFRLLAVGGPAVFAPGAVARFQPRPSLAAFARQYYRYARGDGKAGLWPARHLVRYVTYGVAGPGLALLGLAQPVWWAVLGAGFAIGMLRTPYRRLRRQWSALPAAGRLAAAAWVPVIRLTGDVAKMAGYPAGILWRWRHRPPAWRPSPDVGRL